MAELPELIPSAQTHERIGFHGQCFEYPLHETARIRPGICRLGNWLAEGEFAPMRSLNGRIDELALWNRALGLSEIRSEIERGKF